MPIDTQHARAVAAARIVAHDPGVVVAAREDADRALDLRDKRESAKRRAAAGCRADDALWGEEVGGGSGRGEAFEGESVGTLGAAEVEAGAVFVAEGKG